MAILMVLLMCLLFTAVRKFSVAVNIQFRLCYPSTPSLSHMCKLLSLLLMPLKDQAVKDKALQNMASMSSAQIVSATAIHNKLGLPGIPRPAFPGAGVRTSLAPC